MPVETVGHASNEELLLWAPVPTEVTSREVAERIARAAGDVELLAEVIAWFVRRHAGLIDDVTAEIDAACPRGVPNDYHHAVMEHDGWNAMEDALYGALRALDAVVPDGRLFQ